MASVGLRGSKQLHRFRIEPIVLVIHDLRRAADEQLAAVSPGEGSPAHESAGTVPVTRETDPGGDGPGVSRRRPPA
jgi:hypothetical protein